MESCVSNESDEVAITNIEDAIKMMFETSCKLLITEKLCDAEFNLCVNTIYTTLTYMKSKREKSCEQA